MLDNLLSNILGTPKKEPLADGAASSPSIANLLIILFLLYVGAKLLLPKPPEQLPPESPCDPPFQF